MTLSHTQAAERASIIGFVQELLGGEPQGEAERTAAHAMLPEPMRQATIAEPLVLRVTRFGALFRYPDEQNWEGRLVSVECGYNLDGACHDASWRQPLATVPVQDSPAAARTDKLQVAAHELVSFER